MLVASNGSSNLQITPLLKYSLSQLYTSVGVLARPSKCSAPRLLVKHRGAAWRRAMTRAAFAMGRIAAGTRCYAAFAAVWCASGTQQSTAATAPGDGPLEFSVY